MLGIVRLHLPPSHPVSWDLGPRQSPGISVPASTSAETTRRETCLIRLVICFSTPAPSARFVVVLFVWFLLSFWSFVCFVASDVLTTICHLAIVNVCMIIILYIGNTQISILLLCFLYLFVELMIMMNEIK